MSSPVGEMEVDAGHNAYLDVIRTYSGPLSAAMSAMGAAGGDAARSLALTDVNEAAGATRSVSRGAARFLEALVSSRCPAYMRGADGQLQEALKLMVDGARRAGDAADATDHVGLERASIEIEAANRDVVAAALRILEWRSGAARP